MRVLIGFVLSLGWLSHATPAQAQLVKITDVRVGFPHNNDDHHKVGYWAPVLVEVEVLGDDLDGVLVAETADCDGVNTRYSPRRIRLRREDRKDVFLTYARISSRMPNVLVSIQGQVGRSEVEARFSYPNDRKNSAFTQALDPHTKVVLSIGNAFGLGNEAGVEEPEPVSRTPNYSGIVNPWVATFQTEVTRLPEHWFGYEGVDVVVLPTGQSWQGSPAQKLLMNETRRLALQQWVEMGGHLVVSISGNHTKLSDLAAFPIEPILPAKVNPTKTAGSMRLEALKGYVDSKVPKDERFRRESEIRFFNAELAALTPRHTARIVSSELERKVPVVVDGTYGLGRVTLLAFDTDTGPFTTWENRRDFWVALLDLKAALKQTKQNPNMAWGPGGYGYREDLSSQLCNRLENFGDIQIISFAWVAAFIFIYILIVGPVDYFFLKKVVKRLEWTWITFPTVVLTVSLGAYFLANYLKGNQLEVNKLDLVDIDLHTNQMYGSSWFTVKSPLLQHYTMGAQGSGLGGKEQGMIISWMGRPGNDARSFGRGQSPSLFFRSYDFDFEDEAKNLKRNPTARGVPIQVWSMKTMNARWAAPLDAKKPTLQSDLRESPVVYLSGGVTNNLPWDLQNCQLIFGKHVWDLGELKAGQKVAVPSKEAELSSLAFPTWGTDATLPLPARQTGYRRNYNTPEAFSNLPALMRRMMFADKLPQADNMQNDYLDWLDQSWRLDFSEAILIGMLKSEDGSAAELNQTKRPGCKLEPFQPELRGTLKQTTIVRVFIPVLAGE